MVIYGLIPVIIGIIFLLTGLSLKVPVKGFAAVFVMIIKVIFIIIGLAMVVLLAPPLYKAYLRYGI